MKLDKITHHCHSLEKIFQYVLFLVNTRVASAVHRGEATAVCRMSADNIISSKISGKLLLHPVHQATRQQFLMELTQVILLAASALRHATTRARVSWPLPPPNTVAACPIPSHCRRDAHSRGWPGVGARCGRRGCLPAAALGLPPPRAAAPKCAGGDLSAGEGHISGGLCHAWLYTPARGEEGGRTGRVEGR